MSLCTFPQVNNMATRVMSDMSVLHEMAPAELTSLQLFSSSAVLSMKVTSKMFSSFGMSTTTKPKMMKGAKSTGLNLPRLLNLRPTIYNAGPVSLLHGVCQLGLGAHRVLPLLLDGAAVLHEPAAALLAHNGPALKL